MSKKFKDSKELSEAEVASVMSRLTGKLSQAGFDKDLKKDIDVFTTELIKKDKDEQ